MSLDKGDYRLPNDGESKPIVFISFAAKQKLDYYVSCTQGEISGFGLVEEIGDNFLITDVFILPQECTSISTVIEGVHVARLIRELDAKGVDVSKLKLWWHSHFDFPTYWSSIDVETINEFNDRRWMVHVVVNQLHDYQVRLDEYKPRRQTIGNLKFVVHTDTDSELKKKIADEVAEKVRMLNLRKSKIWQNDEETGEGDGD